MYVPLFFVCHPVFVVHQLLGLLMRSRWQRKNTASCATLAKVQRQKAMPTQPLTLLLCLNALSSSSGLLLFLHPKADDVRSIKLAKFCGRGSVARENWPIKSLNHDTWPILSFATLYDITFMNTQYQITLFFIALFFLHLMNENKYYIG